MSVLHCAVGNGHEDCVECLLKAGAKVNAEGSVTGRTPLYLAIDINNKAMVKMLLKHKSRINVTDNFGMYTWCKLWLPIICIYFQYSSLK